MVSTEKMATSGIRGCLPEMQRFCKDGSDTVPTTVAGHIELALESVEKKHKDETSSDRSTGTEAGLMKALISGSTMRGHLVALGRHVTAL